MKIPLRHLLAPLCVGCLVLGFSREVQAQSIRLTIDEAIRLGSANSDSLRYARLEYKFDIARYRLSVRQYFPAVTVGYTSNDTVAYFAPDSRVKKLFVGIEQLLYGGGVRVRERRAARDRIRIQSRGIERQENKLRLEIVNRYVEIMKLGLQVVILEETLKMGREQALIAAEELKLGEITRLDLVEIELAVQDLEIELSQLEQQERRLRFELKDLLGIPTNRLIELSGAVNPEFRGWLPTTNVHYYVDCARNRSVDVLERTAQVRRLEGAVQQARGSWLPRVSTQIELSASGESLPLTEPGLSLGLALDFAAPLVPLHTGVNVGASSAEQRFTGASASAQLGENLAAGQSRALALLDLQKAQGDLDAFLRNLEFSIREQLQTRTFALETLLLEERRIELQKQRLEIEALMLEIGEITRLEYLQSSIEVARSRSEQLSRITDLFQIETGLLSLCDAQMLDGYHRRVLTGSREEARLDGDE